MMTQWNYIVMQGKEVLHPTDLGGCVTLKSEPRIGLRHTLTIVDDLYGSASCVCYHHIYMGSPSIHCVLHQFLDDGGRTLYYLSGRYLIGHRVGKKMNDIHRLLFCVCFSTIIYYVCPKGCTASLNRWSYCLQGTSSCHSKGEAVGPKGLSHISRQVGLLVPRGCLTSLIGGTAEQEAPHKHQRQQSPFSSLFLEKVKLKRLHLILLMKSLLAKVSMLNMSSLSARMALLFLVKMT